MSLRFSSLQISFAVSMVATAVGASAQSPALATIRREIETARKKGNVQGLSVAIVKDGKLLFVDGFGFADVAKHRRATAETVYPIGSCSKAFTALLAAQAVQEGKLSLSDRPSKYLPSFRLKDPSANDKITLEDMLSHRSGLPRTDTAWYAGDFSQDELLQIVAQATPTAPLGKKWQYQNLMFTFSGMIEAKVYGKSYDALLKERVFEPLGMAHSVSTYQETLRAKGLSVGYPNLGSASAAHPLPLKDIDRVAPAGSIASTARDMGAYVKMLLAYGDFDGKRVFAKAAVEETRKPRIEVAPGTGISYGLGWIISPAKGGVNVQHGGNIDGFTAFVSLYPSDGLGIVVLSNADSSAVPEQVAGIVFDALGTKAVAKEGGVSEKFEEATAEELGAYAIKGLPVEVSFSREGKATFMTQNGQKIPLKLVGPKRYTIQNALFMTFGIPGKDGQRTVKLEQGGQTFSMTRPEPFKSPIAANELLAKAVEARGGAEAIRRHERTVIRYRRSKPSEAIELYGIRYRRDAVSEADFAVFYALDRRFATMLTSVGDGSVAVVSSFRPTTTETGTEAADALLDSNLYADLDPLRSYKALDVIREDKVAGVPVFVLQKTTPSGLKILDFISKTDYRVLRRQTSKGGPLAGEEFSEFHSIDGLLVPFRTVSTDLSGEKTTEEILSIRFDESIPEWPFHAGR